MEVNFSAAQQTALEALARRSGKDTAQVVLEAVDLLLDDAQFTAAVEEGVASLDRGEYRTHEEVGERIDRILRR